MELTTFTAFLVTGGAIVLAPLCPAATVITALYVFGDSLSDSGNVSMFSGGANPGADYFAGRYSNGPVWVEQLATDYLHIAAPAPMLAGGTNHAWAGAYSSGGSDVPSAIAQVNGFIATGATFGPTDAVTIWIGANDILLGGINDPNIPVGHLVDAIGLLASAGATTIIVPNLPDLGDTPAISSLG